MIDSGLVLFVGLFVLLIWRFFSQRCLSKWLVYANYCSILYALLLVLFVYALVLLIDAGMLSNATQKHHKAGQAQWLKPFCSFSPIALGLTYVTCSVQTWQHVGQIKNGNAASQHERVVMIIALPAIYGVMALSAMVLMCQILDAHAEEDKEQVNAARRLRETCFRVGDLYEAWVLYQFGKLTLELIKTSLSKLAASKDEEERGTARGLLVAHDAVESQMWLGTWMFVVVCVLQSGWSCWMMMFAAPESRQGFKNTDAQFAAAGVVASMAAIYNVHAVERTYQPYLQGYAPFLKFISVKILVSFAFFQRGAFTFLQAFQTTLPSVLGKILPSMPIVREIITFSEIQFEAFYAALILYEVFIIAALHAWAWNTTEEWYGEYRCDAVEDPAESSPLPASLRTYKSTSSGC